MGPVEPSIFAKAKACILGRELEPRQPLHCNKKVSQRLSEISMEDQSSRPVAYEGLGTRSIELMQSEQPQSEHPPSEPANEMGSANSGALTQSGPVGPLAAAVPGSRSPVPVLG